MTTPDKIAQLIERFDRHRADYTQNSYKEAQTRQEFINPFFKSLGWDMDNERGLPEATKEVIHEANVKIGKATKSPDYCFRIGSHWKFFVEAKKPAVDINEQMSAAYQLRRYGWSAKLPLSILTDFEEFAVYDCRIPPKKTDKASHARLMYLTYAEYASRWEEIAATFSRDAVLSGSFDHYADAHRDKRGVLEVDVAFLQEIERWRDLLARNFALRNPALTRRELNFAVQRTIDRIIFLRICEDRGIEEYGRLLAIRNGERVYQRLLTLFYQADDRYNSGIFHFKTERDHPEAHDALTPHLQLDDVVLKDIFKTLYYPDSPYEFSVIPADILGQVYEQFLGKVIRLTAGHQAKVEEKPEVKKAGGVYYTPTYIVEYIVRQTVGELLNEKTPKQADALAILDPACGSGSFLIGAYQYLLDWYRDQYVRDPHKWNKGRQPRLYQVRQQEWKLTIDERKRILLSHIYGVDIDSQAVEVTKLSLLLKVLEGEDEQTISSQMALFKQRVLPDLSKNIKCGNSLIGSDFYEGKQLTLLDEEDMYRVNAFDWDKEFPEIVSRGGFDCIIGNPPYFNLNTVDKPIFHYLAKKYPAIHTGYNDIMYYFLHIGIELLNDSGLFGMITSNYYLGNSYAKLLRKYLKTFITKLVNFADYKVFKNADIHTAILIASKNPSSNEIFYFTIKQELAFDNVEEHLERILLLRENLTEDWLIADSTKNLLLEKMYRVSLLLGDITIIKKGATSGNRKIFTITAKYAHENHFETELLKKSINSKDIKRYYLCESGKYLIYIDEQTNVQNYPRIYEYLLSHKYELSARNEVQEKKYSWYRMERPRERFVFDSLEKLVVPYRAEKNMFAYDHEQRFNDGGGSYAIILNEKTALNIKYLLGILNSTLLNWQYGFIGKPKGKSREYFNEPMAKIPIRLINFDDPAEKAQHNRMVSLVELMLSLHEQFHEATIPQTQTMLKRQIEATDRQIDRLVYELYGLTDEEIAIVEGGQ